MDDVLTPDRPVVFHVTKDTPILFGALAWADGEFLEGERAAGRLPGP